MEASLKRFSFKAMGSTCEVQFYSDSRVAAKDITRQLSAEISRLERKYSRFRNDSAIADINHSAGNDFGVKIDKETQSLFRHALSCYEQSNGLFDVTSGVLYRAWDFRSGIVPTQSQLDKLLPLVGFNKLSWRKSRVLVPAGMEVDFGGIVKEYAADSAAKLARSLGVEHGLVNLGGDFTVIGPQPGNLPWTVGVANPKEPGTLMAKIDLLEGGLASSGDYERFFMHEGKRYSHILNPKTGWPSSGLRAVSVASNLCTLAGSVATIAMLRDDADGKTWLTESGLPHVYMDSEEAIGGVGLKED